MLKDFIISENALGTGEHNKLCAALISKGQLGHSPLKGTFVGSQGFGFSFTKESIGEVLQIFPYLRDFLEVCFRDSHHSALWTKRERLCRRWLGQIPNAYYLNVLAIPKAKTIYPHVDKTLDSLLPGAVAFPKMVSVLYLDYPKGASGGELRLMRGPRQIAQLEAKPGRLIHFRGELAHAVEPWDHPKDTAERRISLVLEHYLLAKKQLDTMPPPPQTTPGEFRRILKDVKNKPVPRMMVDLPNGETAWSDELLITNSPKKAREKGKGHDK